MNYIKKWKYFFPDVLLEEYEKVVNFNKEIQAQRPKLKQTYQRPEAAPTPGSLLEKISAETDSAGNRSSADTRAYWKRRRSNFAAQ